MTTLTRRATPGPAPQLADIDRESWFGPLAPLADTDDLARAWALVAAQLAAAFPGARLYRTSTLTGASCAESALPTRRYPPACDAARAVIRTAAPQHRQQATALPGARSAILALYDRRLAYLRHLRHLPTTMGHTEHDHFSHPVYDPTRPGWYRCTVSVPAGWGHIGLVHAANDDDTTWRWPDAPGDTFDGWYYWRELALLQEHAWPVQLHEAWLFDPRNLRGADPLRLFADRMRLLLAAADAAPPAPVASLVRYALRAVVLRFLGLLHRLPVGAVETYASYDDLPPEGPGDRSALLPDGRWQLLHPAAPDSYQARWYRPEWSAAIWAASRVAITRDALLLPRPAVAAIDADALYLLADPGWADTGRIGELRPSGAWTRGSPRAAPRDLAAYRAIAHDREGW